MWIGKPKPWLIDSEGHGSQMQQKTDAEVRYDQQKPQVYHWLVDCKLTNAPALLLDSRHDMFVFQILLKTLTHPLVAVLPGPSC